MKLKQTLEKAKCPYSSGLADCECSGELQFGQVRVLPWIPGFDTIFWMMPYVPDRQWRPPASHLHDIGRSCHGMGGSRNTLTRILGAAEIEKAAT